MGIKHIVYVSILILLFTSVASAQLPELHQVVERLICLLVWIMPAIMVLLISVGGLLILTGTPERRSMGKGIIVNAAIGLLIFLGLIVFVNLTLPQVDLSMCLSMSRGTVADARVGYAQVPTPTRTYVYITSGNYAYFDGSMSTSPVGIAEYNWEFGDGDWGSGVSVSHLYDEVGTYYATLVVKDNNGVYSAPSGVIVTVNPKLEGIIGGEE